jgi:hypothetical protein
MENTILIGQGVLNWSSRERISDRYGYVTLDGYDKFNINRSGSEGELICEILETRQSNHVGDLFHGIFPSTPKVGEEISLGKGLLSFNADAVGLKPKDGRTKWWLDPKALYRVHCQTVRLWFREEN